MVLTLAVMAIISPRVAFSREGELQDLYALFTEEQMVVTPSKFAIPIGQSPSTMTVITKEEIRNSGATSIPDLLRRVPGMDVMQTTPADFNVSIRGDNQLVANKLLVLIDGRTIQDEVNHIVFWTAIPIGLEEIERIEIIRGPSSAIWGSTAFDGVVNIITKSPRDQKGTFFSVAGGEFETALGSLIHAGEHGNLDYKFSLGIHRANMWEERKSQALDLTRYDLQLRYHLTPEKQIRISGGVSDVPHNDGPVFGAARWRSDARYGYFKLDYEDPRNEIRGYWNRLKIRSGFTASIPFTAPDFAYTSDLYNLEWQHQNRINASHHLVSGASLRVNDVEGNMLNRRTLLRLYGVFLQNEWTPADSVFVVIGGRYDYHSQFHQTFSPRMSMLYRPTPSQTLRFMAGSGYRAQSICETLCQYKRVFSASTTPESTFGNTDLTPEKINAYEVAYSALLFGRFKGEVNLFYNQLSNLIRLGMVAPNEKTFDNVGKADLYGGEIGGDFFINPWATTFINMVHQGIDNHDSPSSVWRVAPKYKINSGIRMQFENSLTANVLVHYVSETEYPPLATITASGRSPHVEAYTLLNLSMGYRPGQRNVEIGFSVFNLLNDLHREHPLGDEIGRRALAHLHVKF